MSSNETIEARTNTTRLARRRVSLVGSRRATLWPRHLLKRSLRGAVRCRSPVMSCFVCRMRRAAEMPMRIGLAWPVRGEARVRSPHADAVALPVCCTVQCCASSRHRGGEVEDAVLCSALSASRASTGGRCFAMSESARGACSRSLVALTKSSTARTGSHTASSRVSCLVSLRAQSSQCRQ